MQIPARMPARPALARPGRRSRDRRPEGARRPRRLGRPHARGDHGPVHPFLEENGFEVRVEEGSAVYADADIMAATDLIVQANTMTTIEPEEMAGLYAAVVAGTGMAGWHGASPTPTGTRPTTCT